MHSKVIGTKNTVENERNKVPTLMVLTFNKLVFSMGKVSRQYFGTYKEQTHPVLGVYNLVE